MSADPVQIALLRGVNVGGAGLLPMAGLRDLLAGLGCSQVQTYLQSGNAVFRSARPAEEIAGAIEEAVAARFGFRPAVQLRDLPQFEAALAACPFGPPAGEEKTVHLFFLARPAPAPDLAALDALKAPDEAYALTDTTFYLSAPSGIGRSKLAAAAERRIGIPLTARNLRSVRAIADLARNLPG